VIKITNQHSYSFFGSKTAIIVKSPSKQDPFIFFTCIRKLSEGVWEKLPQGKTTRFNLEEMIMILQVLKGEVNNWSTYHTHKEEKYQIAFKWSEKKEQKEKVLSVVIADYPKLLTFSQIEILKLLMEHLLHEKIEFATTPQKRKEKEDQITVTEEVIEDGNIKTGPSVPSSNSKTKEMKNVKGEITGETEKALLIKFHEGNEVWVPKSTIQSSYNPVKNQNQSFSIDTWFLEKQKIKI